MGKRDDEEEAQQLNQDTFVGLLHSNAISIDRLKLLDDNGLSHLTRRGSY